MNRVRKKRAQSVLQKRFKNIYNGKKRSKYECKQGKIIIVKVLVFIYSNVHVLSDETSIFYMYNETITQKGADDVCLILEHYFFKILDPKVRKLVIFCDSCADQNKELHDNKIFSLCDLLKETF